MTAPLTFPAYRFTLSTPHGSSDLSTSDPHVAASWLTDAFCSLSAADTLTVGIYGIDRADRIASRLMMLACPTIDHVLSALRCEATAVLTLSRAA